VVKGKETDGSEPKEKPRPGCLVRGFSVQSRKRDVHVP
jgi:hypothetical protein